MPFPSYLFLFAFLPGALAGYFVLGRLGRGAAHLWLAAASLLFYSANDLRAVPFLLLASAVSFGAGRAISGRRAAGRHSAAGRALALALLFLAAVGLACKAASIPAAGEWRLGGAGAPWALSFLLLAQSAYLVEVAQGGEAAREPLRFAAFALFFPRLPVGGSLSHGDWTARERHDSAFRFQPANVAEGLALFARGLALKTLLADNLSLLARHLFDDLALYGRPAPFFAWAGTLAFAFQIYFELAGYAAMARGAARMFNVDMPPFFDSPFRARSVSAFWSGWYRPLGDFVADLQFVFSFELALPLVLLALGAWHAASTRAFWPCLAWGAWSALCVAVQRSRHGLRLPGRSAWLLTFVAVLAGWVLFRSQSLREAATVLAALCGHGGGEALRPQLAALFQGSEAKEYALAFAALAASPFAALLREREWRPSLPGALGTALLLVLAVLCLPSAREFLYAHF